MNAWDFIRRNDQRARSALHLARGGFQRPRDGTGVATFTSLSEQQLPNAIYSYDFTESSGLIQDNSSHAAHATSTDGPGVFNYSLVPPSGLPGAIGFPGTKAFIVPDSWAFNTNASPLSIEVVVKATDWSQIYSFLHKGNILNAGSRGMVLSSVDAFQNPGVSLFGMQSDVQWRAARPSGTNPMVNSAWNYVVVTMAPSLTTIYVGGVPIATEIRIDDGVVAQPNPITEYGDGGTEPLTVGAQNNNGSVVPLLGGMAHAALYNNIMSPALIAQKAALVGS